MASIIISSDLRDQFTSETLPKLLKAAGHQVQVAHPLAKISEAVEFVCLACGGFDLGILVDASLDEEGQDSPYSVAKTLRGLRDDYIFRNAVKGKSLPLLVIGKDLPQHSAEYEKTARLDWVSIFNLADSIEFIPKAADDLIFAWKTSLLKELSCVGYAVSIGPNNTLSVDPAFKKTEVEGEILGRRTNLLRLKQAGYLIVSSDICRAASSYRQLAYLVDNFRKIAKARQTKPEEVFQTFFNSNPRLLFQQSFAELWPKPRLQYPEDPRRWLEPDFVVKPCVAPQLGSRWQVLDIKLPDVDLTQKKKFHPTFSQKLASALRQVAKYRNYFGRVDAAPHLVKAFGMQPINPQLAVLIGRNPSVETAEILERTFEETQTLQVKIISYDEVLKTESLRIASDLEWIRRLT